MDKLTLTRQFGIQFEIFLGRYREVEWNNIDSYRRKGSVLIQTLYLWDRERGRGGIGREEEEKTEDFTT